MQHTTVISTVGTSLFNNLNNLKEDEATRDLLRAYRNSDWGQVTAQLKRRKPSDRICGAEINSLHDLIERKESGNMLHSLHFAVSDTEQGYSVGEILRLYFSDRYHTQVHTIEDLQDKIPSRFRTYGLRNLARKIGEIIRNAGDPKFVGINATGGYKAQIAIAVLIGQALNVDVFYKHELFSEIISFPPMPISFDYDLLGREAGLLTFLEEGKEVELPPDQVDHALRAILEEVEVEGKTLWALAPIGQIYLEGFRHRHPVEKTLPLPASQKTEPTFRDDHFPDGFKGYVKKVWKETPCITGCHSLDYSGQRGIRDRTFYIRFDGQIVGEYVDSNSFGARFAVNTTATSSAQKTAVVLDLLDRYGNE